MECLLSKYHKSTVEIKDCNVLIDGKSFFDAPVRNKEEAYEDIIEMLKDNDYTRGNMLDYDECFSKHYRLITIDLCKQIKLENSDITQYINFTGRFDRDERATMFSSINFLWNAVLYKMETQKIINLLNDSSNEQPKFATKNWYVIDSQTAKDKYTKMTVLSLKQVGADTDHI